MASVSAELPLLSSSVMTERNNDSEERTLSCLAITLFAQRAVKTDLTVRQATINPGITPDK
jgi:hypothetical protein